MHEKSERVDYLATLDVGMAREGHETYFNIARYTSIFKTSVEFHSLVVTKEAQPHSRGGAQPRYSVWPK